MSDWREAYDSALQSLRGGEGIGGWEMDLLRRRVEDAVNSQAARAEAFERALRVCIWNECKERGMRDADAYKVIRQRIEAVLASVDRSGEAGETPKSGSTVGESPVVEDETPNLQDGDRQ